MSKKIRMIRTEKGSPDGIRIVTFIKDKDYVVSNKLADIFVNQMKVAIEVIHSDTEEKMMTVAPLNKSVEVEKIKNNTTEAKPRVRLGRKRGK